MAGNVWEWCADTTRTGAGTESPDERVMRGGSFLCDASHCVGYRVSARMKSSADTSLAHTGFRCVRDAAETR